MSYARIADKTVAEEYFAVTEKVEALYDQPRELPGDDEGSEMRKLRGEMHRRMLGKGYCARPVEMECHFESICESCTFFVTTIEFKPTLRKQREDAVARVKSPARRSSTGSSAASTPRPHRDALDTITRITTTTDTATEIRARRVVTLDAAYTANPARICGRRPTPAKLPTASWINNPTINTDVQSKN